MKYLHIIYKMQIAGISIRSVDVARELGVTKASVSRMVKLLEGMGFIAMEKYSEITLTNKGQNEGAAIHEKIMQIYPFFADYLELEEPEAIHNAYSFLGSFSENCVEQLVCKGWAI